MLQKYMLQAYIMYIWIVWGEMNDFTRMTVTCTSSRLDW